MRKKGGLRYVREARSYGGDETTHSAKPESGPSRANERDSFSHLLQTGVADRRYDISYAVEGRSSCDWGPTTVRPLGSASLWKSGCRARMEHPRLAAWRVGHPAESESDSGIPHT